MRETLPDRLTVAIIVDRDAAARILGLADRAHVWAADTAANRRAAEQVWQRRKGMRGELYITLFQFDDVSAEQMVANELASVELHVGSNGQVPPWSRACVFGAAATPFLTDEFRRLGFEVVAEEPATGFTAVRAGKAG